MKQLKLLVSLTVALAWSAIGQNASGTGGISGVITDATGSAIPGALVVVENQAKGIRRELTTTEGGIFATPSLVPASGYSVTITKGGFTTYRAENVNVQVGETVTLTPTLQISSAATRVDVTSEGARHQYQQNRSFPSCRLAADPGSADQRSACRQFCVADTWGHQRPGVRTSDLPRESRRQHIPYRRD
jgi:carboxypeptidase family protein